MEVPEVELGSPLVEDIRKIVSSRVHELTPAEKRCARVLLADYPAAGLGSAASLAQAAGTSTPTVLRFVSRLGFGNYRDFQRRLRDEITRAATSPVQRAARTRREKPTEGGLLAMIDQRVALVERLSATVPEAEFNSAVELLAAKPRRTLLTGGFFTDHLAALMALQLSQLITGVEHTRDPLKRDIGKYLDLKKDGVSILFDFRRYEEDSVRLARLVRAQGARVILFTDHELSPAAGHATIVLPVPVDGIPFDSDAAVIVLLEAVVEGVFHALGDKAIRRMSIWEQNVRLARVYPRT